MAPRQLTRRCAGGWRVGRVWGGSGRPGVAQPTPLFCGQRVGQGAQQCAVVVEDLHDGPVNADGDALTGQVVADGLLPAGQANGTTGVDEPIDLDRPRGSGGKRWRTRDATAVGEQLAQVR